MRDMNAGDIIGHAVGIFTIWAAAFLALMAIFMILGIAYRLPLALIQLHSSHALYLPRKGKEWFFYTIVSGAGMAAMVGYASTSWARINGNPVASMPNSIHFVLLTFCLGPVAYSLIKGRFVRPEEQFDGAEELKTNQVFGGFQKHLKKFLGL